MADYLVRPYRHGYQISKWDEANEPEAIYFIFETKKGWQCDSLGCYRKPECKHAKLVQAWKKQVGNGYIMPDRMLNLKDVL